MAKGRRHSPGSMADVVSLVRGLPLIQGDGKRLINPTPEEADGSL